MKLTITIQMQSDAFVNDAQAEVTRILEDLVARFKQQSWTTHSGKLYDINGNTVGNVVLSGED